MSEETKTFTYDEAFEASKEYFGGEDELAPKVFLDKYALRNKEEELIEKTPTDMHHRLAREFARIEAKYPNAVSEEEIFKSFKDFKHIVPQGSPMSSIGNTNQLQTVGNCYVLNSPEDSYGGIFKTDQEQAQIQKRRGGVGFDISKIRPKGMATSNAARTTDGISIFMERFSNTCREVATQGRRGALLLTLDCHHPEIKTFINIKRDLIKVTGANISVRWSDEFLQAVEKDEQVQLRYPVEPGLENYDLDKMVSAKEIWDEFVISSHQSGEPGNLYWNTILTQTPSDIYHEEGFRTQSANPCGEVVMNQDSCRLLLLNAFSFVQSPFTSSARFKWKEFESKVELAQRLMDDLVDIELEKIDAILAKIKKDPESNNTKSVEKTLWETFRTNCKNGRRTGLGLTGIGDTIAALGLKYGDKSSIKKVEEIYKTLALSGYKTSCKLAKERGAFPIYNFDKEEGHPFIEKLYKANPELRDMHKKFGRRNIALTTTAPCGSVSIMTQTSSGIEPVFMTQYKRRKKINSSDITSRVDFVDQLGDSWQEFDVYHHGVKRWMDITGKDNVGDSPYADSTANEIDWESAVELQAAAQKWVCHAISKTINLPKSATIEDVHKVYWKGWKTGCKGMTVYRDGCRSGVLVSQDSEPADNGGRPTQVTQTQAPKRPKELTCEIHHATVNGTPWTVLLGMMGEDPYELFMGHSDTISLPKKCQVGRIVKLKKGQYDLHVDIGGEDLVVKNILKSFNNPESSWATRMVSIALRHGCSSSYIQDQLSKDGGIGDINKVLSRIFKKFIKNGSKVKISQNCGECGGDALIYVEGCMQCTACGWSKC